MALHNTEELKAGPTSQLEFEVLNDQNQTYEFPAASSAPYMPPRRRTSGAKALIAVAFYGTAKAVPFVQFFRKASIQLRPAPQTPGSRSTPSPSPLL
jgi:hypothetical protein